MASHPNQSFFDFSKVPAPKPGTGGSVLAAGLNQSGPTTNPNQDNPADKKVHKRIGDLLIERNLISQRQLDQALGEARATGEPVGSVLVKNGFVKDKDLGEALATLHGLEYIDLASIQIDGSIVNLLPEDFIRTNYIMPIGLDKANRRIEVVMARPDNLKILDEVTLITGYRAIPRVTTHTEMSKLLDQFFIRNFSSNDALAEIEKDFAGGESIYESDNKVKQLESEMSAEDAPVVKLVNSILVEAIEINASDIHIEPQQERLLVRYRIDGILREAHSLPKKLAQPVVSRIKVASEMDISERRRPQDGHLKIRVGTQVIDLRVNTLSVRFGEKVVMRILKPTATTGGLEKLGLTEKEITILNRLIKSPNGILLVTGPTGSGKTTTLYSCLREINTSAINISTVEDPIEYPLAGVNQSQVSVKAGLTFAACLRALLRQDPDVIMIGEIRDHETLETAIHAALTGHLVLSTLHTNSAAKTVARLIEMGAPGYMVSTSVLGVVAQRLVRRICPMCKEAYQPSALDLEILGLTEQNKQKPVVLQKGKGCSRCNNSGYEGRVGLYEMMEFNRAIQDVVTANANFAQIEDIAIQSGMMTLAMDCKRKILAGMTTVEEYVRILGYAKQ